MYQPSSVRVPSVTSVDPAALPPSLTDYSVPFHHTPVSSMSSDLPGMWRTFVSFDLVIFFILTQEINVCVCTHTYIYINKLILNVNAKRNFKTSCRSIAVLVCHILLLF